MTSSTSTPDSLGTGNTVTSTIQYKDIGIILKVKPRINEGGLVSMELSQEISSFGTQSIGGTALPNPATRQSGQTELRLQEVGIKEHGEGAVSPSRGSLPMNFFWGAHPANDATGGKRVEA